MNRPGVCERVAELKEENSRKATLSREQTIEFLCNAINTSVARVEADSPLVQSAEFVDGQLVRIKIPDNISAVRELVRMYGWAKPDRVELSARVNVDWHAISRARALGPPSGEPLTPSPRMFRAEELLCRPR